MTYTAIILVLVSAVFHAGWNLASKKKLPSAAFFLSLNMAACIVFLPVLAYLHETVALIPLEVWRLLAITGVFQAAYFIALAGAYRTGDLSIVYPIARSSPILVVTFVTLALGKGDEVSWLLIAGIALVFVGCILLPMKKFNDLHLKNYLNVSCLLAIAAAAGTTGYSITDDHAINLLQASQKTLSSLELAITYAGLEAISTCIFLTIWVLLFSEERKRFAKICKHSKRHTVATGLAIYIAYLLVVIAYGEPGNVSYVVAFRQVSVPIGCILGILLLKEPAHKPKWVGIALVFTGLILVGFG